jgi:hypothetical protein
MKNLLTLPLCISALAIGALVTSCSTTQSANTSANVSKVVSSASSIAALALQTYGTYAAVTQGTATPNQIANTASADLNGIASIAQAYVGSTPAAANLVQGASPATTTPASTVAKALPAAPITQAEVNNLYSAASLVLK